MYNVGIQFAQILYANGKKEEGISVLKRSYEIGKKGNFPDVGQVEDILKQLGAL